jgi:hypothetical protein
LIRKVFRFDLAPDISMLPCVPDCRNRGDRFVPRFLARLATLFVLMPRLYQATRLFLACWLLLASGLGAPTAAAAQDGPLPGVELSEKATAKSEAAEAWDAVKNTTNPALLEAFIKRYGTTFFAEIAKARLDELKAAAARPAPADAAKAIPIYPIRPGQETPADSLHQTPVPMPTDGVQQRAGLYDEDPTNPKGRQFFGSVIWRTEQIKTEGKPDELVAHADIDIPSRGLQMTMSLRRNLDPSLPASHVIDLTFRTPIDFDGGGVVKVPGILMKSNELARGTPLAGLAVKVTGGVFLVGLSNVATDRQRNAGLLLDRTWFDIPIVYVNQRRAILAIEKGLSGEEVFKTVFTAWGQYPGATQPAAGIPEHDSGNGGAR